MQGGTCHSRVIVTSSYQQPALPAPHEPSKPMYIQKDARGDLPFKGYCNIWLQYYGQYQAIGKHNLYYQQDRPRGPVPKQGRIMFERMFAHRECESQVLSRFTALFIEASTKLL